MPPAYTTCKFKRNEPSMYKTHEIVAIIPARGGSKGIPGKNIKPLGDKPMIAYTIEASLNSRYIDDVIVTTDSEEIASIANEYGAETPFLRPAALAQDTSKSIDALVHARDWLADHGRTYDAAAWLQPTSPLRRAQELDGAIETFYEHGRIAVASVAEVTVNPIMMRRLDEYDVLHPLLPTSSTIRRQDMPKYYYVDGAICINQFEALNNDTSLNDNPIGYIMPKERSIDIDTIEDFKRVEQILEKMRAKTRCF